MNETTIATGAHKLAYGGAGLGAAGLFTLTEWLSIAGFGVALAASLVSMYATYRKDKREEEEHLARMSRKIE
jgi:hypothetical protein